MHEDDQGHSLAAWIGVTVMLVATAVACWGIMFGPMALFWIGSAGFLVGAGVWYAMARAGKGSTPAQSH